ncbi:hypothetical protein SARC_00791 [Sphaeroforma arctica JP610]|uniref:Mediator of RNA polymerase II transcription subunit 17 n=1 Tax=Sphaeroforma arctica JP610 TaxID=667725 RepID=A0A0L0GDG2_9EUKA|nr:hypothetical protein SARC_00791 [Sphaeroforma arctica JP610]KNC87045.1 hypothetical protein SARC_00791 [Sphaeroforma arctica JP610]|eukprot:XP_014160947.1 hypothetical protein SARC_00791 [Sphaeroforma arctica JP610]
MQSEKKQRRSGLMGIQIGKRRKYVSVFVLADEPPHMSRVQDAEASQTNNSDTKTIGPQTKDKDIAKDREIGKGALSEVKEWKWQSTLNHLNQAKAETDITADLLKLIQDGNTMVLDNAFLNMAPFKEARKPSAALRMATKRQQFTSASSILKKSAERLSAAVQQDADYFVHTQELQRLWLLKHRRNNQISIDVSLRSCGSDFSGPSELNVIKRPANTRSVAAKAVSFHLPPEMSIPRAIQCYLETKEGTSQIDMPVLPVTSKQCKQTDTISRLRRTQHFLYAQGLFSYLNQSSTSLSNVPVSSSGNTICIKIDSNRQLVMQLVSAANAGSIRSKSAENNDTHTSLSARMPSDIVSATNAMFSSALSIVLHLLARKQQSASHIASHAPPGYDLEQLDSHSKHAFSIGSREPGSKTPILSRFYDIVRHISCCQIVRTTLAHFAEVNSDPTVVIHWLPTNCMNISYATVNLRVAGMLLSNDGAKFRVFSITVDGTQISVVTESGEAYSPSVDELADFLACQLAAVQLDAMVLGARVLGWTLLRKDSSRQCIASQFSMTIRSGMTVLSIKLVPNAETMKISVELSGRTGSATLYGKPAHKLLALAWDYTPERSLREKLSLLLFQASCNAMP